MRETQKMVCKLIVIYYFYTRGLKQLFDYLKPSEHVLVLLSRSCLNNLCKCFSYLTKLRFNHPMFRLVNIDRYLSCFILFQTYMSSWNSICTRMMLSQVSMNDLVAILLAKFFNSRSVWAEIHIQVTYFGMYMFISVILLFPRRSSWLGYGSGDVGNKVSHSHRGHGRCK